jgi:hypothetical protein
MDAKKLEAMRAAAAARARASNRTSSRQVVIGRKAAAASARVERSNRATRDVEQVLRVGGRSGRPRKLDAVE